MPEKFKTVMERVTSMGVDVATTKMDVKNFRSEVAGRFDGVEKSVNDIVEHHINPLQARVDSHQKLLYGTILGVLANIAVSFFTK